MTPAIFAKYMFTISFTAILWMLALGLIPSNWIAWFAFAFFTLSDVLVIAWDRSDDIRRKDQDIRHLDSDS